MDLTGLSLQELEQLKATASPEDARKIRARIRKLREGTGGRTRNLSRGRRAVQTTIHGEVASRRRRRKRGGPSTEAQWEEWWNKLPPLHRKGCGCIQCITSRTELAFEKGDPVAHIDNKYRESKITGTVVAVGKKKGVRVCKVQQADGNQVTVYALDLVLNGPLTDITDDRGYRFYRSRHPGTAGVLEHLDSDGLKAELKKMTTRTKEIGREHPQYARLQEHKLAARFLLAELEAKQR